VCVYICMCMYICMCIWLIYFIHAHKYMRINTRVHKLTNLQTHNNNLPGHLTGHLPIHHMMTGHLPGHLHIYNRSMQIER
jgi:hypothetical protein